MIAKIPFSEIEKVSIYLNTAKKSVSAIKLETGAELRYWPDTGRVVLTLRRREASDRP